MQRPLISGMWKAVARNCSFTQPRYLPWHHGIVELMFSPICKRKSVVEHDLMTRSPKPQLGFGLEQADDLMQCRCE